MRRPGAGDQKVGGFDRGRARLPRRQQETQKSYVPACLRLAQIRPLSRAHYWYKRDQGKRRTKPSSPWLTAASSACTPWSETAPSTIHPTHRLPAAVWYAT